MTFDLHQINLIRRCLDDFCSKSQSSIFTIKDVMPYLVDRGVFNKVDSRNGSQLRKIFRKLNKEGTLNELIPQVIAEKKNKNISWFIKYR